MNKFRAIILGVAVLTAGAFVAMPQAFASAEHERESVTDRAFNDGITQGHWDAKHHRPYNSRRHGWRDDRERRAYEDGYRTGYREASHRRDEGNNWRDDHDNGRHRGWDRDQQAAAAPSAPANNESFHSAGNVGYQDG